MTCLTETEQLRCEIYFLRDLTSGATGNAFLPGNGICVLWCLVLLLVKLSSTYVLFPNRSEINKALHLLQTFPPIFSSLI